MHPGPFRSDLPPLPNIARGRKRAEAIGYPDRHENTPVVLTREKGWRRIEASYGRTNLLSGGSLRNSQRNTKDGVGSQLALVGGTIELLQEVVNSGLVLDVDVRRDQSGSNDVVDVGNGLQDTLSSPLRLVAVTELDSLVLA
jgi:hypothetical protein